jgi:hypothetical protein
MTPLYGYQIDTWWIDPERKAASGDTERKP